MTKEEYILALKAALKNKGVEEYDKVVDKYEARFTLAKEAGFSEEEAIEKFGTPEEVAASYQKKPVEPEVVVDKPKEEREESKTDKSKDYLFSLVADDIEFSYSDSIVNPVVDFNDANPDYYQITNTDDLYKLEMKPKAADFFHSFKHSHLKVALPSEVKAKSFRVDVVSSHVVFNKIIADVLKITAVSGIVDAEDARADLVSVSVVSGKMNFKNINANEFKVSMVTGGVEVGCGEIGTLRANSVSGDVKINSGHVGTSSMSSITGKIILNNKQ